jgi:cell division protein FtsQ
MKRWLTFVSVLAVAVALGGVFSRIPEALSEVETFRVTEVRLQGNRFLSHEEVVATLALGPQASVWDDKGHLEARLREHPLVEDVVVRRRFPNSLLLQIEERLPVALYPNPTLEPVDEAGRILPIDPAQHKLDLPIMAGTGGDGSGTLTPADLRLLAGEIVRLAEDDPELHSSISDFALHPRGDVSAQLSDPPVTVHFRPGLPCGRIQTGLRVLADAQARFEEGDVAHLDLRWEDQVVVRFARAGGN